MVTGAMTLTMYSADDGPLRPSVMVNVEQMTVEPSLTMTLLEPVTRTMANASEASVARFEDFYFYIKDTAGVQISAKTNLNRIKKAIIKERRREREKRVEEHKIQREEETDEEAEQELQVIRQDSKKRVYDLTGGTSGSVAGSKKAAVSTSQASTSNTTVQEEMLEMNVDAEDFRNPGSSGASNSDLSGSGGTDDMEALLKWHEQVDKQYPRKQ